MLSSSNHFHICISIIYYCNWVSIYQCGQLYSNQFIMSYCVTILLCILSEEVQIRSWGAFLDGAFSDLCSASVYFRTRGKCCSVYLDRPSWPFVIFPYFMFVCFDQNWMFFALMGSFVDMSRTKISMSLIYCIYLRCELGKYKSNFLTASLSWGWIELIF